MGRRSRSTLPVRTNQLRGRIERWRRQRTKRSPMPEELWSAAVSLARRHGVYPIARALQVDYGALKKRATPRSRGGEKMGKASPEFVEIASTPLFGCAEPIGPVVELWDADRSKLVVRLSEGEELDVLGLAEAFWRRRR